MALADQTYGFFIPTVSLMGVGCSKETGAQAKALGATNLLIVTDAGLSKMGVADKIKVQLEEAGLKAVIFDGAEPNPADLLDDLSSLLMDAVESGAGVSFMSDLSLDRAREWWSKVFSQSSSKAVILAARDELGVVGTVQLQPSWAPNQPHRADVAKLIVHRRARGKGVARDLMRELERYARRRVRRHGRQMLREPTGLHQGRPRRALRAVPERAVRSPDGAVREHRGHAARARYPRGTQDQCEMPSDGYGRPDHSRAILRRRISRRL